MYYLANKNLVSNVFQYGSDKVLSMKFHTCPSYSNQLVFKLVCNLLITSLTSLQTLDNLA